MKSIFRILFGFLLIFHAGIVESYAQCGPNTIEFVSEQQKLYNTACGDVSYQPVEGTIPTGKNGSGNIPSFTAVNAGSTPISGTITVTPTLNDCAGASSTYSITFNPLPVLAPANWLKANSQVR